MSITALLHEPLPLFLAQAILVIGLARSVGLLGRLIGQPMVIAEIVAGILLGPSLLGWLHPGLEAALFPRGSLPFLGSLSQIGLILFMFLVGLEMDPAMLRDRGRASVLISHTSIIVPFGLGAIVAIYLYPRLSDPHVPFSSFTLFMGVAMSITAFPVLARILSERGLLRSKVGAVTITCAAVDDVTAWCILAFVVSVARSTGFMTAVRTSLLALVYIGVMLGLVRPFLSRLAARGSNREGLTQNMVAATFLLLLLSSGVTELIGIHALFGAFMMGVSTPKHGGFAQTLAEKLEDFVVVFLLPLFFAYSGLRTQIGLLDSPAAWATCGLIILLACVGKFGGSAVAARITGLSWREASALGILMNTRGLMELVVLNIGLDIGVISPRLFTMMVIMALVTTFMTTPLLQWIYPPEQLARELARDPGEHAEPPPLPVAAFSALLCVSYERSGLGMVVLARALCGPAHNAGKLYALKLIRPSDRPSFYMGDKHVEQGAAVLAPVLARAKALDMQVRPLSFVSAEPAQDICNVAEVKGVDLVLLGWQKPLLNQAALGGTVYQVMQQAHSTVGVLVDRGLSQVRRVLVPYCGTEHDRMALRLANRLQQQAGADVTILHVVSPARSAQDPRLLAREQVEHVFGHAEGPTVHMKVVTQESPAQAALLEAGQGYDLVLIGVGAEWGLLQRPFGIQPELLIRKSPVSLLIVRAAGPLPAGGRT